MKIAVTTRIFFKQLIPLLLPFITSACQGTHSLPFSDSQDDYTDSFNSALKRLDPTVKVIDQTLTREFSHLKQHQGQIVVARDHWQLVTANIPPIEGISSFTPLFSRLYRLQNGAWQASLFQPQLDVKLSTRGGEALQLIGQDIEQKNGRLKFIANFRGTKSSGTMARVELELGPDSTPLTMNLVKLGSSQALQWQIRLAKGLGEENLLPLNQEQHFGVSVSLLPEMFSILSTRPLDIKADPRYTTMAGILLGDDEKTNLLLFLDRDATLDQAGIASTLKTCLQKSKGRDSDCFKQTRSPKVNWRVKLPARSNEDSGKNRLFQPLYIHDRNGDFLATLAIFEGETLRLALPEHQSWEILYPNSQGILSKLTMDPTQHFALLPPIALGSVQLSSPENGPSFIDLRDAIHQDGVAWASTLASAPEDVISAHSFLQKSWPFKVDLPAGDYKVQLFRGATVLCSQSFTVLPQKSIPISCPKDKQTQSMAMRTSLSLDSIQDSAEMIQAAQIQAVGRLTKSGGDGSPNLTEIPMLRLEDSNLGIALRAFPITNAQRDVWQQIKPRDENELFTVFAHFARTQNPPLELMMECPKMGEQLDEYRWLALTISPDILEVFGCPYPYSAADLLKIAHLLQQKSDHPIKLSAANHFQTLPNGISLMPAIHIPADGKSPLLMSEAHILKALRQGNYSLGLRSEILLVGALPKLSVIDPQQLNLKIRSYDLQNQSAIIRVYDQKQQLAEYTLLPTLDPEQQVSLKVKLNTDSSYLRFELLTKGLSAHADDKAKTETLILATSNFMSLSPPP